MLIDHFFYDKTITLPALIILGVGSFFHIYRKLPKDPREIQKQITEYQYILEDKQKSLNNYIKHPDTACEMGKLDKIQVIEIVKNKYEESIISLMD